MYYIEYLNANNGFQRAKKTFKTEQQAVKWAKKNLPNFNQDMIKINP